jgi:hypothetical protein
MSNIRHSNLRQTPLQLGLEFAAKLLKNNMKEGNKKNKSNSKSNRNS